MQKCGYRIKGVLRIKDINRILFFNIKQKNGHSYLATIEGLSWKGTFIKFGYV